MNFFEQFGFPVAKAICYSGFRDGQQPGGVSPSYEKVKHYLKRMHKKWKYLTQYDRETKA